jgi:predicted O-methyltransferase YrrM
MHWKLLLKFKVFKIDRIITHLTLEEKIKLYKLASKKEGVFVEVGSYLGASASIIALAITDKRIIGKLFCIDTWGNDAMSEGKTNTFAEFKENTKHFDGIVSPIVGNSVETAEWFDKRIDFLFIDGDHSYEGVKADVNAWLPKLNKDALVVFHDIGWAEGVKKIIEDDIMPRAINTGMLPNMWWGWIE